MGRISFAATQALSEIIKAERGSIRCAIVEQLRAQGDKLVVYERMEKEALRLYESDYDEVVKTIKRDRHELENEITKILAQARLVTFAADACGSKLHPSLLEFDTETRRQLKNISMNGDPGGR